MKALTITLFMGAALASTGCAGVTTKSQTLAMHTNHTGPVCLIAGPVANAQVLGRVLAQKRAYGELSSVVKPLADEARSLGANAVTNYQHTYRFTGKLSGVVVPFARGTAVEIDNLDTAYCVSLGGIEA